MTSQVCFTTEGSTPVLISMPHNGTALAPEIEPKLTPTAREVPDTDWAIDVLYDFAEQLGVHTLQPTYNRIVIDLNRDPQGVNLYPGAQSTELCPTSCFDFSDIYRQGMAPDAHEVARRVQTYWQPYHSTLALKLEQIRAEHGIAILLDAHSIRSQVARFFEGELPDFNFGTADGSSCSDALQTHLAAFDSAPYSQVSNGRFKGGYITRAYGQPQNNIHAVQLELSQRTYMNSTQQTYDEANAAQVKPVLRRFVEHLLSFAQTHKEAL
ncbi:MAG: N-formylglutamate deformylase [Pseudomonadales bacterium]